MNNWIAYYGKYGSTEDISIECFVNDYSDGVFSELGHHTTFHQRLSTVVYPDRSIVDVKTASHSRVDKQTLKHTWTDQKAVFEGCKMTASHCRRTNQVMWLPELGIEVRPSTKFVSQRRAQGLRWIANINSSDTIHTCAMCACTNKWSPAVRGKAVATVVREVVHSRPLSNRSRMSRMSRPSYILDILAFWPSRPERFPLHLSDCSGGRIWILDQI